MSRLWAVSTIAIVWLSSVVAIGASQLLSALLMPRAWKFFWLIPVDWTSPLALTRILASAWMALWARRPFEAFSLTVLLLLLAFSAVWIGVRLWAAGRHALIASRAV